jgi:valyl-tRNA synthetase
MAWLQGFVLGIRQIRGEMDIAPTRPLPVLVADADDRDRALLAAHEALLTTLARTDSIVLLQPGSKTPPAATALLGEMKLLVPMAGLIDVEAELARLARHLEKAVSEQQRVSAKLANPAFVENAPEEVVAKERARHEELAATRAQLTQRIGQLKALG